MMRSPMPSPRSDDGRGRLGSPRLYSPGGSPSGRLNLTPDTRPRTGSATSDAGSACGSTYPTTPVLAPGTGHGMPDFGMSRSVPLNPVEVSRKAEQEGHGDHSHDLGPALLPNRFPSDIVLSTSSLLLDDSAAAQHPLALSPYRPLINPQSPKKGPPFAASLLPNTTRVPFYEFTRPRVKITPWRPRERKRTRAVIIVMCLNVGTSPPGSTQVEGDSTLQCFLNPSDGGIGQRATERVAMKLQSQYETWQQNVMFKVLADPAIEHLEQQLRRYRTNAKDDRVFMHYNGHGVPPPTPHGEIWVFNHKYTQYLPVKMSHLSCWVGYPACYVFDSPNAWTVLDALKQIDILRPTPVESDIVPPNELLVLASCGSGEQLPSNAYFPADMFTSCLTTPIKMAVLWHLYRMKIPQAEAYGVLNNLESKGHAIMVSLQKIFTAITDTIAWTTFSHRLFIRLYRQDMLVAGMFRHFLLALRIMTGFGVTPCTYPHLPPTNHHAQWDTWDMVLDNLLAKCLSGSMKAYNVAASQAAFFDAHIMAFRLWLDVSPTSGSPLAPPEHLPSILQVMISKSACLPSIDLMARFVDIGPWAANVALVVGIFPYLCRVSFGTTPADSETAKPLLLFLWCKLLALGNETVPTEALKHHPSCLNWFVNIIVSPTESAAAISDTAVVVSGWASWPSQVALAACALSRFCKTCPEARQRCIWELSLHNVIGKLLPSLASEESADDSQSSTSSKAVMWLLILASTLAQGTPDIQVALFDAQADVWVGQCATHASSEVRAAAMLLAECSAPAWVDCDESGKAGMARPLHPADVVIIKAIANLSNDLSAWVRLSAAHACCSYLTSLQSSTPAMRKLCGEGRGVLGTTSLSSTSSPPPLNTFESSEGTTTTSPEIGFGYSGITPNDDFTEEMLAGDLLYSLSALETDPMVCIANVVAQPLSLLRGEPQLPAATQAASMSLSHAASASNLELKVPSRSLSSRGIEMGKRGLRLGVRKQGSKASLEARSIDDDHSPHGLASTRSQRRSSLGWGSRQGSQDDLAKAETLSASMPRSPRGELCGSTDEVGDAKDGDDASSLGHWSALHDPPGLATIQVVSHQYNTVFAVEMSNMQSPFLSTSLQGDISSPLAGAHRWKQHTIHTTRLQGSEESEACTQPKVSLVGSIEVSTDPLSKALALHPTSRLAVSGDQKDGVYVWNWDEGKIVNALRLRTTGTDRTTKNPRLGWHAASPSWLGKVVMFQFLDSHLVASTSTGAAYVIAEFTKPSKWAGVSAFRCFSTTVANSVASCLPLSSTLAVSGGTTEPSVVKLFDLRTDHLKIILRTAKGRGPASCIHPGDQAADGPLRSTVLCGHYDGGISLMDTRQGEMVGQVVDTPHESDVLTVKYGKHFQLTSVCTNGVVATWDLRASDKGRLVTMAPEGQHRISRKSTNVISADIHSTAPLLLSSSLSSVRLYSPKGGHLCTMTSDKEGALFRSRLSGVMGSVFHPFLPITLTSCSDGRLLLHSMS